MGIYLVQLAKYLGAGTVIALAGSPKKVEFVREPGADEKLIYRNRSIIGFNFTSLTGMQVRESLARIVELVERCVVKVFADHAYPLGPCCGGVPRELGSADEREGRAGSVNARRVAVPRLRGARRRRSLVYPWRVRDMCRFRDSRFPFWMLVGLAAAAAGGGCRSARPEAGPALVQPGAPGQPSQTISAAAAADLSHVQATEADVKFMQGMIGHHAQAIEMTALLATRTESEDMRKLARRIELSQADEIKMMQAWLRAHGQEVPSEHDHHMHPGMLMPGMLTPEQMAELAAARGPAFDRLFLKYMIRHHDGALVMVHDLFATPGAAQDSDVFAFASDVDADQRMEIERMGAMLKELEK